MVCARWEDVLPGLPAQSVDHVISDPPYEAEAHTLQRRVKRGPVGMETCRPSALSFDPLAESDRQGSASEFVRLSRRWQVVFCQVEAAMKWQAALVGAGASARRIGVWVKPGAMPQYSGDRPGMGYESLVFTHQPGRSTWNGGGRVGVFVHNKNSGGGAHLHETQKPLPLMVELVTLFSDEGEIVLDPFAGSGTTGVACLQTGRRFIGIERDPKYAAIARDRIAGGPTSLDSSTGQRPLFAGL